MGSNVGGGDATNGEYLILGILRNISLYKATNANNVIIVGIPLNNLNKDDMPRKTLDSKLECSSVVFELSGHGIERLFHNYSWF